jgi:serine protease AprX
VINVNALRFFRKSDSSRIVSSLVIFSLLFCSQASYSPAPAGTFLPVIVQAADVSSAVQAVQRQGGTVNRELAVINAVSASIPASQLDALRRLPGVSRVWADSAVERSDSADPGTLYSPREGIEVLPAGFDLARVSACDGNRENVDFIPLSNLVPNVYQTYSFRPGIDTSRLPTTAQVRFLFKEKSLNQAQLQVFRASTNTWQSLAIDPLRTNDAMIDTTFNLSDILTSPGDYAKLEFRFLTSRNEGGEKAEVDCISLSLNNTRYAPVSGAETKPAGFDLKRVLYADSDRDNMDYFPTQTLNPNVYQSYTFAATVDPANLPALIDLQFVFKEKSLNHAQVQVWQASTRSWYSFDIDTLGTDDKFINTTLDLTDVLVTPEDFNRVEVRFLISKAAGGEKAEVDLVRLRLANLIGDTAMDIAANFEAINAASVWSTGTTGDGIGVAVLDSGVRRFQELEKDTLNQKTGLKNGWNAIDGKNDGRRDKNGHGTIVASIVSNMKKNQQGKYYGVAPDSVIIPVQALDETGKGSYSKVIDAIQWVIAHKSEHNIRVLNLSISAPVKSHYWDDPLNQAVMKAWQAGIVVVVAAGNSGPDPLSIGVPGNNPYVITVGALTDSYTPTDLSDDYIPSFSAAGPTVEGFVKPDVVAPGGHIVGLMSDKSELGSEHSDSKVDKDYFTLTGTSMSAAQVSGVVALILAQNPNLTPDQVKYRLMASALPALTADGKPAYSIWQQGAGRVNAYKAVYGNYNGAANQGLNLAADLAGTQHFVGFTRWNPDTSEYYLVDVNEQPIGDGYVWDGGVAWSEAYTWGGGVAWSEAYTLGGGVAWSEAYTLGGGVAWSEFYFLGGGVAWSENDPWAQSAASLASWVQDE